MDPAAFSRTRIYSRRAPPSAIAEDMRAVQQIDRDSERSRRRWDSLLGLGLLATLGLLVAGALDPARGPMYFRGMGLALVVTIIAFVIRRRHAKLDIEDRRYALVARLMRCLAADMQPDQSLYVTMDFRRIDRQIKRTGTGESNGWKIEFYRDPWLRIQGRFVDGTSFGIELAQLLQKRSKRKRSASGKLKYKSKQKGKAVATVKLRAKPDKYPRLAQVSKDAPKAVQLPGHARLNELRIQEHRLVIKSTLDEDWNDQGKGEGDGLRSGAQVVAMMLLSLYQVLNLAKAVHRSEQTA